MSEKYCTTHENDHVECDITNLTSLAPIIAKGWNEINDAHQKLTDSQSQMELAKNLQKSFEGCTGVQPKRVPDITSQNNTVEEIMQKLKNLNIGEFEEYTFDQEDIYDIQEMFDDVSDLYDEIYGMLFGNTTSVPNGPRNQPTKDQFGVYGGFEFMKNPGCWYIDEECDFDVTGYVCAQNTKILLDSIFKKNVLKFQKNRKKMS